MCLCLALDLAKHSKTSYHSRITYLSHWNTWTLHLLPRKRIIKQTGILVHIPATGINMKATRNHQLPVFKDSFTLLILQIDSWSSAATWGLTLNGWWNPARIRKPRLNWNWEYKVAEKSNGVSKSKLLLGLLKHVFMFVHRYTRSRNLFSDIYCAYLEIVLGLASM